MGKGVLNFARGIGKSVTFSNSAHASPLAWEQIMWIDRAVRVAMGCYGDRCQPSSFSRWSNMLASLSIRPKSTVAAECFPKELAPFDVRGSVNVKDETSLV